VPAQTVIAAGSLVAHRGDDVADDLLVGALPGLGGGLVAGASALLANLSRLQRIYPHQYLKL
jgi:hypothetical protein